MTVISKAHFREERMRISGPATRKTGSPRADQFSSDSRHAANLVSRAEKISCA